MRAAARPPMEHHPEVREHGVDHPARATSSGGTGGGARRAFDGQPRGAPRQVEVAAVVVLDVPERADANHGTRHGHRTGRPHEERSPEAVRPGRRRRQAASGVDDEAAIPQRVHDGVVGAVEALAGVHVHRGVVAAPGPPDTCTRTPHRPSSEVRRRRRRPGDRRSRPSTPSVRHAESSQDLRRVTQGGELGRGQPVRDASVAGTDSCPRPRARARARTGVVVARHGIGVDNRPSVHEIDVVDG